jgi:hypothetical protein
VKSFFYEPYQGISPPLLSSPLLLSHSSLSSSILFFNSTSFFYFSSLGAVLGPQDFVVGLGRGTTHLLANVVRLVLHALKLKQRPLRVYTRNLMFLQHLNASVRLRIHTHSHTHTQWLDIGSISIYSTSRLQSPPSSMTLLNINS